MTNFDDLKFAVEALSGGKNTVILDDIGMPSVVVPVPKLKYSDVIPSGTQETLPAFIVDGEEIDVIHVSKYQNIVMNDRAYSLPFKDPAVNLEFSRAVNVCRNKGPGWHMLTNALWAAIQNWCYKNGTVPRGNTNFGCSDSHPYEKGIISGYDESGKGTRTATGSGPTTWYHNYESGGIADLVGNVAEMTAGVQVVQGEIQLIPYGNAMKSNCNMNPDSPDWKGILQTGAFVEPGTAGTMKYDGRTAGGGIRFNTAVEFRHSTGDAFNELFKDILPKAGVVVPKMLEGLALAPVSGYNYTGGRSFVINAGIRHVYRGQYYEFQDASAGMQGLIMAHEPGEALPWLGFRSAYCDKLGAGGL